MNTQPDLFEARPAIRIADPAVRDTVETPRLSHQCQMILALLRAGPVSNRTLSCAALKYTSRISDLRASGFDIRASVDRKTGFTVYTLH